MKFSETHEWVKIEGNIGTVGVTKHAQEELGDIVYVEVPEVGAALSAGEQAGVVESVKAASDIYSPVQGEVVEVNEALEEQPETVNGSPYEDGWIFRLKPDSQDFGHLLDAEAYAQQCEE